MRKIVSGVIVFLLVSVAYLHLYADADNETTTIVSHVYGINEVKETKLKVSVEKAKEIEEDLKELKNAIKYDDEKTALKISSRLKKEGIFSQKTIDLIRNQLQGNPFLNSNLTITNLLCFVLGFGGDGLFIYSLDILVILLLIFLLGWYPFGILFIMLFTAIWLTISHIIPIRFAMPLAMFLIGNGELLTAGLKGAKSIEPKNNETAAGLLVGFIGTIIDIPLPKEDGKERIKFFCIGYSLAVLQ